MKAFVTWSLVGVLAALMPLPPAAAAPEPWMRPGGVPVDQHAEPSFERATPRSRAAVRQSDAPGCRTDQVGDVVDVASGTAGGPASADLTRWCVDLGEDGLAFAITTAEPVQAASTLDQGAHGLAVVSAGVEYSVNINAIDGAPQARVFDQGGAQTCTQPAEFDAGYLVTFLPLTCLGGGAMSVDAAAFIYSSDASTQHFDEDPAVPGVVTVPRHAGPAVDRHDESTQGDGGAAPPAPATQPPTLFDGNLATTERLPVGDPVAAGVEASRRRLVDGGARHVVLARNDAFADALAASPLTAEGPLLLTPGGALSASVLEETRRVLPAGGTVYVLGGVTAISDGVAQQVRDAGFAVARLQGPDRIATAIAVSTEVARLYNGGAAPTVVIARAFGEGSAAWADSVTGGGWAASTRTPVLVTPTDALDPRVAEALRTLAVGESIVLGGVAAISDEVIAQLPVPRRIAGPDRSTTAAQISTDLWGPSSRYLIVNGYRDDGWAYGLTAGGLAAATSAPILISDAETVPPATLAKVGLGCGTGEAVIDVALIGTDSVLGAAVQQAVDAHDGGTCAPPPLPPPPPPTSEVPGPTSLGGPVDIGGGHLASAGVERSYWTEFVTASSSCIEGGLERVVVVDAAGRRATTVPGTTAAGLSVDLSPSGQHAIVDGFCDDGWFLKGYADVAPDGDLVNFREVGGSYSYDESALRWRSDGLLYGLLDTGPDFDTVDLELRLIDPATGGMAIPLDFVPNSYPLLDVHTPEVTVTTEFFGGQSHLVLYGADGTVVDYVIDQQSATVSPDGEWLVTIPFGSNELTAYRINDLRAGIIQPVGTFAPPGEFVADLMWSDSGQLALSMGQPAAADVYVWDPDTGLAAGQPVLLDQGRCEYVFFADFSPNEDILYLGKDSGCATERDHRALALAVGR